MTHPKDIVRSGYDTASWAYRPDDAPDGRYGVWLAEATEGLPPGADALDLGCGCGIPAARWLVERGFSVTGADISPVQIERARKLVPGATFLCQDMTDLELAPRCLDAIVCLWAIIHVPLEEQPALIAAMHRCLRPGGRLLITVGAGPWTGIEEDWCDVPGAVMYWSHEGTETYLAWLRDAGFEIGWHRFVPEDDGGHTLVLARA
jgi:SAM-dependent methyltransferase